MSDVVKKLSELSPERRALLQKLLRRKAEQQQSPPAVATLSIPRRERDGGPLPVSFAQQRLWFLDQLEPGNAAFNIPVALRLSGDLKSEVLERCLREIVRRHEVLRTAFRVVEGEPSQIISPEVDITLRVEDLEPLDPTEREAEVLRRSVEEAARPFDLARAPMVRAALLRLGPRDHVVLFTMHHIASDGWSAGVLVDEVARLYEAFSEGRESPLAELPVQYADFALWQRERLQGAQLEKHLDYWKRQLRNLTTLALPTDRARPPVPSYRGDRASLTLTPELTTEIKTLARREGVTLFMVLLAVFQTLLYRYTGQDDIVVGTDIANRTREETERLIGFFVNMLALRTDFSRNPTFTELLKRVRKVTFEAYAHQDLPFEKLVAALQLERDPSRFPVFQVVFVLQNAPVQGLELPGLVLRSVPVNYHTVKFDLICFMLERNGALTAHLDYRTDLFDAETVRRLLRHYEKLLREVVAQPEAHVDALEIFTTEEMMESREKGKERREAARKRVVGARRKSVDLGALEPVKVGTLGEDEPIPAVVNPRIGGVNLSKWAANNRERLDALLLKHGAVLLRGFDVPTAGVFEEVARAICPTLFGEYGDLPRAEEGGSIYGSTPYPPDQSILFHSESSHMHRWPMKIFFHCVRAAQQGGETPLVDCRRIYQTLDPDIRERFERKGIMYVRNYTEALDVSWQEFFHTSERSRVEDYCRRAGIEFEWKGENGLRTSQVCRAVARHPRTGETVFFNQLQLHHVSCLDPAAYESLRALFKEEDYPRNVYYGDGTPIDDEVVRRVLEVYRECEVSFPWQEGDILMLDNMLTAHGRNPYVGPRKIVVAMGEMFTEETARQHAASS